MLPAQQGDCIVLEYGVDEENTSLIIIDSGMGKECTRKLQKIIEERANILGKPIDLLILTHYDYDHIDGFLKLFKTDIISQDTIEEMWFNFGQSLSEAVDEQEFLTIEVNNSQLTTSADHGMDLHKALCNKKINTQSFISAGMNFEIKGANIKILSPSIPQLKELIKSGGKKIVYDSTSLETGSEAITKDINLSINDAANQSYSESTVTPENKSSIAFIFEYENKRILFLGDSVSSQIEHELRQLGYSEENKLQIDACKIAHHGSEHNTSNSLFKILDCNNYLLSGKWGKSRPTKTCLSRIVLNATKPTVFRCNYPPQAIFTDTEMKEHCITLTMVGESELII